MFSKISRYRTLPDFVMVDAESRSLESKGLRLLPEVSGEFLHTVEDVDRLDHLAYKFYKQPRKWWRICDANPDFMAPQAMLDKDPVKTVRFYLDIGDKGADPPWHDLVVRLLKETGVEDARLIENINLLTDYFFRIDDQFLLNLQADGVPDDVLTALESIKDQLFTGREKFVGVLESLDENEGVEEFILPITNRARLTRDGEIVTFHIQSFDHSIIVGYNQINTNVEAVSNVITDAGFNIERSEEIGQIGKNIIIPPNTTG